MNKISIFVLIFLSIVLKSQKCSDITQNITANGHFNFTMIDDISFKYYQKDSIQSLKLIETNSETNLKLFQKKFPDIYDGKCLKIKSKDIANAVDFCDEKQKEDIDLERPKKFGRFKLISIIDNFFIFKYSGFQLGGYIIFNSSDSFFYVFNENLQISPDRKIAYSISSNPYYGLTIKFLQFDSYRDLTYTIQGNIDVESINMLKYSNTGNYGLLLKFNRKIDIRNENYDIIGKENCITKLRID